MDNGLKSQYGIRLSAPLFPYGIERMKTKKQDQNPSQTRICFLAKGQQYEKLSSTSFQIIEFFLNYSIISIQLNSG